jgi:flagellar motor switch protein FliG
MQQEETQERSAYEKVAVLLQLMGEDVAAKVLRALPMSEVQKITTAIMHMKPPDAEEAQAIANEFLELLRQSGGLLLSGEDFAKTMIQRAFDTPSAARLIEAIGSTEDYDIFGELNQMDPKMLAEFLKGEHPQTMALVLAHLDPALSGRLLSELPQKTTAEVLLRLANIKEVSPSVLRDISEALRNEISKVGGKGKVVGGLKKVADILNQTDKTVESEVMKIIQETDGNLAEEIQQLMFLFDDIVKLDDKAIQEILKEVDTRLLAKALRGASEEVKERIFQNMSKRAASVIQEEMEMMGPTRLSEVEEAQLEIIKIALKLRDSGGIVIRKGVEEDVLV